MTSLEQLQKLLNIRLIMQFESVPKNPTRQLENRVTESIDSNEWNATLADEHRSQEEALVAEETVRIVWRECVDLVSREQLALFLFDRNDILWPALYQPSHKKNMAIATAPGFAP